MRIWISFILISISLSSCATYDYSPTGFVVENDSFYHNAREQFSFQITNEGSTKQINHIFDLKLKRLHPTNRKILSRLGISAKDVELYFSAKQSSSNFILFKSKDSMFNKDNLTLQIHAEGRHYYKQIETNQYLIQYAVIPEKDHDLGLMYYQPKSLKTSDFDKLLHQSLAIKKSKFFPDKTAIECIDKVGNISIEFPEHLVFPIDYSLIKIYKIDTDHQKKLVLFTLRNPNERPYISFKVCAGNYEVQYTDIWHRIIWKEAKSVVGEL